MSTATHSTETQRLILRRFEISDFAALHNILGDPRIGKWLGKTCGFTLTDTKNLWDDFELSWAEEGFGPWGIIHKVEETLIGYCGLGFSDIYNEIELHHIIHPQFEGQDFELEVIQKVLDMGFHQFQFPSIVAIIHHEHIAYRQVLEVLGMSLEKELKREGGSFVWYRIAKESQ